MRGIPRPRDRRTLRLIERPCRGLELFYPRDHRLFAPPANIQHPSGVGFCGDEIVTALLPSYAKKPDTNYTNCHELHEALGRSNPCRFVAIRVSALQSKKNQKKLAMISFIR